MVVIVSSMERIFFSMVLLGNKKFILFKMFFLDVF